MERRKIVELLTLYELEPSLRDIYVEGPTDRAFVSGVVRRLNLPQVQVREIDQVEIDAGHLSRMGLSEGAKQRVIALAVALSFESKIDLARQVACIADADDEAGKDAAIRAPLLLYTDVTSMPIYGFDGKYLQWYFDVGTMGFPLSGQQVVEQLIPPLRSLCALRRALAVLEVNVALASITKDCSFSGGQLQFDYDRFVKRCKSKDASFAKEKKIQDAVARQLSVLGSDHRLWAGAEDFVSLLNWLIVKMRGQKHTVPEHLLARTILLGVPIDDVLNWNLFRELLRRTAPSQLQTTETLQ
jgi:hypothetical protein